MRICCIIQARTGSTRLPGKVLLPLPEHSEKTVLSHVITRVQKSKRITDIIVATTTNNMDDAVIENAKKEQVSYYRGSESNVLSRFYHACKGKQFDYIVRITSDCPCIDAKVLDSLIDFHIENSYDYSSNAIERTFPQGLDAEIFSQDLLEQAYKNGVTKYEKEHVTPYFYQTKKNELNIGSYKQKQNCSNIRVTLDTKEDYILLLAVYDYFQDKQDFELEDLITLYQNKNWLYQINSSIEQKRIFNMQEDEIKYAVEYLKRQELFYAANILEVAYDKNID